MPPRHLPPAMGPERGREAMTSRSPTPAVAPGRRSRRMGQRPGGWHPAPTATTDGTPPPPQGDRSCDGSDPGTSMLSPWHEAPARLRVRSRLATGPAASPRRRPSPRGHRPAASDQVAPRPGGTVLGQSARPSPSAQGARRRQGADGAPRPGRAPAAPVGAVQGKAGVGPGARSHPRSTLPRASPGQGQGRSWTAAISLPFGQGELGHDSGPASQPTSPQPDAESDLDQPLANRVQHRLGAIVDPQLLVHVADVVADGLLADLEPIGDLLVGHPTGQQLQDLDLAVG